MLRTSSAWRMNVWDTPFFEHNPLLRFWKKSININGSALSAGSIPRHIHGYIEGTNARTESQIRWFPYKKEMTVDGRLVPTFTDILYQYYFPPHLNDDEQVKYTALKTGRSELEVAEEIFLMRKIKLFCAQLLRNKLRNRPVRMPEGMDYSGIERRYTIGLSRVALELGMSMYSTHSFDPIMVYSPQYGLGECLDTIVTKQLRTSQQYLMVELVVHRGISRTRFSQISEDPKFPISHIEPCTYEAIKLKMAIGSLLAKEEHYVVDHMFDKGHRYGGMLIHLYPNSSDPEVIDHHIEHVEVDLDFARMFLKHYYDTYVAPQRGLIRN
ncbi:Hypothetical protein, putative [Bodo saltans]|uniref:Uncharacterized protein n=1 Tax=Bodo saltans TaxID=75058 RepID=A0A0S4KFH5_BODSA|nr:Hypothetical protein, putative [Bodo saltans]|eukprot:CUI14408.1 Hypothetical protein, putative [Bodo saltans]